MMLRDDEELLHGYQAAVVSSRALRARAANARAAGSIDYLAEAEEAYNNGIAAACGWLLGVSPVTPQTSVPAVVNPDTTRAELEAAKAEQAAGQRAQPGAAAERSAELRILIRRTTSAQQATCTTAATLIADGTGSPARRRLSMWRAIASRISDSHSSTVLPVAATPGRSGAYAL